MEDPLAFILAHAPPDDEPFTEQDRQAVAEADHWLRHNQAISLETVLADFGLGLSDWERMGNTPPHPLWRWISISARAGEVFANREKAMHWLQTPNPSLAGRMPLEAATNDDGYQEVEDILTRIEHGVLG
jgi:putative toxin-antitoxin system antitoxin component (TIGR02293 family)